MKESEALSSFCFDCNKKMYWFDVFVRCWLLSLLLLLLLINSCVIVASIVRLRPSSTRRMQTKCRERMSFMHECCCHLPGRGLLCRVKRKHDCIRTGSFLLCNHLQPTPVICKWRWFWHPSPLFVSFTCHTYICIYTHSSHVAISSKSPANLWQLCPYLSISSLSILLSLLECYLSNTWLVLFWMLVWWIETRAMYPPLPKTCWKLPQGYFTA